ncbi:PREDICTED: uncharacterized protein LOC108748604, partial [Trachymyrmex septentrionalis]|uniref:uncharacterized protein LOC108748604 n=1 Tax=Trachymyrmex septentrionalis TaxID=34720 RepID=UPI00084F76C1
QLPRRRFLALAVLTKLLEQVLVALILDKIQDLDLHLAPHNLIRALDCSIRTSLLLIFHRRRLVPPLLVLVNRLQIPPHHYLVTKLLLQDLEQHLRLVQLRLLHSELIQVSILALMLGLHYSTRLLNRLDKHQGFHSELHLRLQVDL